MPIMREDCSRGVGVAVGGKSVSCRLLVWLAFLALFGFSSFVVTVTTGSLWLATRFFSTMTAAAAEAADDAAADAAARRTDDRVVRDICIVFGGTNNNDGTCTGWCGT